MLMTETKRLKEIWERAEKASEGPFGVALVNLASDSSDIKSRYEEIER